MTFTVTNGNILALPANPIPLPYTMTTIAGGAAANCSSETDSFGDGCPATSIIFGGSVDLRSVAADPFGNVYLTDGVASVSAPHRVQRRHHRFCRQDRAVQPARRAQRLAAPLRKSALDKPRGIASDAEGNIYIAGYDSHEVFKVSASTGLLYLVAGTGTAGSSGDGGPATSAQVNAPRGVWADTVGNVYIADTSNNKIRVVDIAGNIHTFAGTGTASSLGDGGLATSATIDNPQGVMTDANLNVYIADSSGGKIRVVCVTCGTGSPLDSLLAALGITSAQNGYIYTIAGGGTSSGGYPTLATNVSMSPQKLAIDLSGNIYVSDGNGVAWLLDAHTANIRPIAGDTSSNCSTASDNFGDGCPALQAVIGDGGNGIGVGTDTLGNLYISDTLNARIRKVVTGLASPATATASTISQAVEFHFVPGDTVASANGLAYTSNEWSLTTPACTTNSDSTSDCLLTSSFTPAVPGARSTPLTVTSAQGNASILGLTGVGLGSGATLDPATQSSFGSSLTVTGLAADNAGNIYVSDSNTKQVFRFTPAAQAQGASAAGTALGTFAAPGAIAVDPRGFVYVADTSAGTVTQISPTGTATPLPFSFTTPAGRGCRCAEQSLRLGFRGASCLPDRSHHRSSSTRCRWGRWFRPAGLAIDPAGNLLVADPGAPAIYRFNFATSTRTTVSSPAVSPSAALTDAAGNLLIADTVSILAVPASSNSAPFTVASLAPSALAVDSAGNLYTGSAGGVLKLERTQGYLQFAASSTAQTVNLLESGNELYSASSFTQTDTTDYALAPTASTDCALSSSGSGTLAIGGVCALTATYTPTSYSTTSDAITFNGNLSNAALSTPPSVNLTLTGPATTPTSTTTLGAFSPASPIFGQPVTLSATVTGAALTPTGSVVFTVGSSTSSATLVNGTASTVVNGLSAGSHSVSAAYTSSNGYTSSTSTTATLVVGKATPVVTWPTPAAITYGATLSAMQLDASASIGGTLTYSPSAGTVLGAGIQTLSVLFTPTATADYQSVTQTVQLTVNKAASSVALSANPNPAVQGKPDVLTATVTGAGQPGGIVVFLSGSTTLCTSTLNSGIATCSFTPSASGTLSITAQYQGDANHLASSASLTLNVYDTAITEQFSSTQLVYPGATNVTVCVAGKAPTPTGTIQIVDGTTVLTTLTLGDNGCAYWYISPGLSAGTHTLTSVYSGNQNYPSGSSAPTILTVSPVPVNMSVSCWNSSFPYGGNYQCTVNVSSNAGSAQGNVTYNFDGGSQVSVPLSGGNAQFTIAKPAAGNHTVTIGYAQQTNYAAATAQTENFTVTPAPVNVSLTPSTWNAKSGTSVTFQAAVASWSAGPPDDNGSVSFYNGLDVARYRARQQRWPGQLHHVHFTDRPRHDYRQLRRRRQLCLWLKQRYDYADSVNRRSVRE